MSAWFLDSKLSTCFYCTLIVFLLSQPKQLSYTAVISCDLELIVEKVMKSNDSFFNGLLIRVQNIDVTEQCSMAW